MALQGLCHHFPLCCYVLFMWRIYFEAISEFYCSPQHVKSEPEDDFYLPPKHEKSLKRERDDDVE